MGEICSLIWSSTVEQTQDQKPLRSKRKQVESLEKRKVTWKTHIKKVFPPWGNFRRQPLIPCCCCSVTKLCPILCDPMDCSTPGSSVLHFLPEFAQTHVHWVGDAIQPSHPLPPPSSVLHLSQHQVLSQWAGSSHQVNKVLEFQLQKQTFQWILRVEYFLNIKQPSFHTPVCSCYNSEPLPYWKPALGQSRPNVEVRKPIALACRICPGVWERPLLLH